MDDSGCPQERFRDTDACSQHRPGRVCGESGHLFTRQFDMRFRSFILGSMALVVAATCLSSGVTPEKTSYGVNPGELFPRVEMEGFDKTDAGAIDGSDVLIITWRTDDALSRATNAWLTYHADGAVVYSVCLDDTDASAGLYAMADNVAEGTPVFSVSRMGKDLSQRLTRQGPRIYKLSSSRVREVLSPYEVWQYQSGTDHSEMPS